MSKKRPERPCLLLVTPYSLLGLRYSALVTRRSYEAPMPPTASWLPWALGSAAFAALTAVFAKIGLEGIDSDFATLVRTVVIVAVLGAFVATTGKWRDPFAL